MRQHLESMEPMDVFDTHPDSAVFCPCGPIRTLMWSPTHPGIALVNDGMWRFVLIDSLEKKVLRVQVREKFSIFSKKSIFINFFSLHDGGKNFTLFFIFNFFDSQNPSSPILFKRFDPTASSSDIGAVFYGSSMWETVVKAAISFQNGTIHVQNLHSLVQR